MISAVILPNCIFCVVVKQVIGKLKGIIELEDTLVILTSDLDLLGENMIEDNTMKKLRQLSVLDRQQLAVMLITVLAAVIDVLQRQYSRYFSLDITDKLRKETESARANNIDAEEIMGMFSAAAPNATLCFLSCHMRAIKNRTVQYLDSQDDERRDSILRKAVVYGRKQLDRKRKG